MTDNHAGTTSPDLVSTQRRVVRTLAIVQVLGGIGAAAGVAVGALLAADLATESLSGLSSAASVIGAALVAIPVTTVMDRHGRRPGLILSYLIGMLGASLVVLGAVLGWFPLALLGLLLSGGGFAAGLQSRYAATDLAATNNRGRALSTVIWATTIGSVLGPNLASPTGRVAEAIGIPRLAGPYLLTFGVWAVSALLLWVLLRPDPLIVARLARGQDGDTVPAVRKRGSIRDGLATIRAHPAALLGLTSVVIGHAVMVGVMSMTPVHLQHEGASLEIVGIIISGHITGMYIASPLVGIASDRYGRRPVIVLGALVLLAACAFAGTAPVGSHVQLGLGLALLGLGWSCTMIAGSTQLTEAVPLEARPRVQGTSDLVMGIAGASAGLAAGGIVGFASYGALTVVSAVLVVALLARVARGPRARPRPVTA